MSNLFLIFVSFLTTLALTRLFIYWFSNINKFIDIPNERSSHSKSLPTAGGLSVVACFAFLMIYLYSVNLIDINIFILFIFSTVSVSFLGLVDDYFDLSAKLRFLTQIAIASFCTFYCRSICPSLWNS